MPPVSEEETELVQEGSGNLTRSDCLCPICLEIFLEPVTLPCAHTFCKPCFLETVDKANLCCPLCRKRVSTWARLNGRNKTLVNLELWKRIQDAFPTQCQRRLNGIDDEEDINSLIPKPRVSQPGELRQEYEDQISKLVEEKRALEEAERRASEEYIQRLLAEEEERITEERRRQEKRQLEEDEKLARMLSQELNSTSVLESHVNVKVNDAASAKKKKPSVGHIEKFLCPVPWRNANAETSPTAKLLANKENILNTPLPCWPDTVEPTSLEMPILDYCGKPSTSNSDPDASEQLSGIASRTDLSSKRKMSDTELADETDFCKRPCGSILPESPPREDILQEMALEEEALRIRWQQEEEDRRLAQRLQRELDRESAVNRRKGSADCYLLRQKSSPSTSTSPGEENKRGNDSDSLRTKADKVGKRVSRVSTQHEGKTPLKSAISTQGSPSTVSPVQRSTKQTTLTEMFPNMSS
ncbi:E3 ubiquitin-protein ligase rnf168 [Colossoma macropomum]|uniref:E3 ubiquitin-protein ligase rnf168 n=1 Tax=Colossoma macropomum TaxID=42526 RepID=UPI001863F572|nr:E3 ubiquitin-protein ligase rnf168 [Colossoma macropomum]XP_036419093.1 E3 ubiquitin-protein ligase rnf168 [Colossoma macropomum]XP_036419100.1 E3 ubiquitin-protein ligase rnf168 [Colossoma macropomum]